MILMPYRFSLMRGATPYRTASLSPWGSTANVITGSAGGGQGEWRGKGGGGEGEGKGRGKGQRS